MAILFEDLAYPNQVMLFHFIFAAAAWSRKCSPLLQIKKSGYKVHSCRHQSQDTKGDVSDAMSDSHLNLAQRRNKLWTVTMTFSAVGLEQWFSTCRWQPSGNTFPMVLGTETPLSSKTTVMKQP